MNIIYDCLMQYVPQDRKRTAGGWTGFNGPCCIHNRQTRPDTKKRSGVRLTADNICIYHCFNCGFAASWEVGKNLSGRMKNLLDWFGLPSDELKKLNFKIWQLQEIAKVNAPVQEIVRLDFQPRVLPYGAKQINEWIDNPPEDPAFFEVIEYLLSRGEEVVNDFDFYWSPDRKSGMNRRVLIPFRWEGKIVGWTARAIFPSKYRYMSEEQSNYLFNTEVLKSSNRFLVITEGPFDAIAIGGISTLGDHITQAQCNWINSTGKIPIVLPDRENFGGELLKAALREKWHVSFPWTSAASNRAAGWEPSIKDAADAVKTYGRLYALWSIIESKTNNSLSIRTYNQIMMK